MTQGTPKRAYRRHGLATPENLPTYNAVYDVLRHPWARVAPCWQDRVEFTRGVITEIGHRPARNADGRCLLASREDFTYLLDGTTPEPFDADAHFEVCPPETFLSLPPWVLAGYVFQPGQVEWRWVPFNRRVKTKSIKPRPDVFVKGDWGHPDTARLKAAKRRLRAASQDK